MHTCEMNRVKYLHSSMDINWESGKPYRESAVPPKGEANCCTVMAWANCFDSNFETSNTYLSKFGREYRKGMIRSEIEKALASISKYKAEDLGYTKKNTTSLDKFVTEHPTGTYYVLTGGHALAVMDGIIYDFRAGPRRRVNGAWEITKN